MNKNNESGLLQLSDKKIDLLGFRFPINTVLLGCFFVIIISGFLFYTKYTKLISVENQISCVNIEGYVGLAKGTSQSTGISILDSRGGSIYSCYAGECGYKNWRLDIGKNAKLFVCGGVVVDFNIAGVSRLNEREVVNRVGSGLVLNGVIVFVGLFIFLYSLIKLMKGNL
jgi:hypothetical protein